MKYWHHCFSVTQIDAINRWLQWHEQCSCLSHGVLVWTICRDGWIPAAVHTSDRKWRSNQVLSIQNFAKSSNAFLHRLVICFQVMFFNFFGQTTTAQRWDDTMQNDVGGGAANSRNTSHLVRKPLFGIRIYHEWLKLPELDIFRSTSDKESSKRKFVRCVW